MTQRPWYVQMQPTIITLLVLVTILILTLFSHNENKLKSIIQTDENITIIHSFTCQIKDKK